MWAMMDNVYVIELVLEKKVCLAVIAEVQDVRP